MGVVFQRFHDFADPRGWSYAGFLADVIFRNPQKREKGTLVPDAFKTAFEQVKGWISV